MNQSGRIAAQIKCRGLVPESGMPVIAIDLRCTLQQKKFEGLPSPEMITSLKVSGRRTVPLIVGVKLMHLVLGSSV